MKIEILAGASYTGVLDVASQYSLKLMTDSSKVMLTVDTEEPEEMIYHSSAMIVKASSFTVDNLGVKPITLILSDKVFFSKKRGQYLSIGGGGGSSTWETGEDIPTSTTDPTSLADGQAIQDSIIAVHSARLASVASLSAEKTFATPVAIPTLATPLNFSAPVVISQEGTLIRMSTNNPANIVVLTNNGTEDAQTKISLTITTSKTSAKNVDVFLGIYEALDDTTASGGVLVKEIQKTLSGIVGTVLDRVFTMLYTIPAGTTKYLYFTQRASVSEATLESQATFDIVGKTLSGGGASTFFDLTNDTDELGANGNEAMAQKASRTNPNTFAGANTFTETTNFSNSINVVNTTTTRDLIVNENANIMGDLLVNGMASCPNAPTDPNHLTNKAYVDTKISELDIRLSNVEALLGG